jgi:hypothetical protein
MWERAGNANPNMFDPKICPARLSTGAGQINSCLIRESRKAGRFSENAGLLGLFFQSSGAQTEMPDA